MATVPHGLGEERATVPRIVLPITSRGLLVTDRLCWGILAGAMAVAAGLILYLNRGTTFNVDELLWLYDTPHLDASKVLEPYNGNLIAPTRLLYKAILETLGAGYLPFRLLGVSAVLMAAGLFYALVKPRIGALPALAPALVLLFFGPAAHYVLEPVGFSALASIAAGLAALLTLQRNDRRGDTGACALTCLSVVTFSTGLAFLVGVAISVLLRPDRRNRAWIFIVPLALYAAWWIWALDSPRSPGRETTLSNVLLLPSYVAESLADVSAAIVGLSFNFTDSSPSAAALGWGSILAVLAVAALAVRIRRGHVPSSLWISLAIVLAFWALGALAFSSLRVPGASRYIYMGAVGVLLVATDAARSIRFSKLGLAALFGACIFSLATNLALLRDSAAGFRSKYANPARAQLAMIELARDRVDPAFDPGFTLPTVGPVSLIGAGAGSYFAVVDRYGSPAFSLSDVARQPEDVRQGADQVLVSALGLRLRAGSPGRERGCERLRSEAPGAAIAFELPPRGATLRARDVAPAEVTVGRFAANPAAELGSLSPAETATLRIPTDSSPTPWRASVRGAGSVEVCALR